MCVVAMLPCRWLRTVCYQNPLAQQPGHFKLFKCSSSDKCVLLCSICNFHTRPKQFESLHAWLQVESPHEDHGHSRCVRYCSQVRSTEVYFDDSMTLLYPIVSRCHNAFQRSGWRWFWAKAGCASYQCLTCFYNFLSSQVHRGTPERLTPSTLLRHGILVSVDSTMMPPVICKPLTLGHALSNSPSQVKKILSHNNLRMNAWMPMMRLLDRWFQALYECHDMPCQRMSKVPFRLSSGVDLVVHSATKFFSGHADCTGGLVCVRDPAGLPSKGDGGGHCHNITEYPKSEHLVDKMLNLFRNVVD